jgi:hypothetical protein
MGRGEEQYAIIDGKSYKQSLININNNSRVEKNCAFGNVPIGLFIYLTTMIIYAGYVVSVSVIFVYRILPGRGDFAFLKHIKAVN